MRQPTTKVGEGIVLVNPPLTPQVRYGPLAAGGAVEPPYGILYLASALRKRGFPVKVLDAEALGLDVAATVREVARIGPWYLGISAVTSAIRAGGEIARQVKAAFPEMVVIVGGIHITALPGATLREFPDYDLGVLGEGETTLVELLSALESGLSLERVKGLILREGEDFLFTGERGYIEELDSLPLPGWDLLPSFPDGYQVSLQNARRLPAVSLITSRGCMNHCSFCDNSLFGHRVRTHSAGYILEMVRVLARKYGVRGIFFEDDNFMALGDRLLDLCEGLHTKGYFMMGHPEETPSTLRQTITFMRRLKLDDVSLTYFTPFPGSPIHGEIGRYGRLDENWVRMNQFEPVFIASGLTEGELRGAMRRAYRRFYLRPRIVLNYLGRAKDLSLWSGYLKGWLALIRYLFQLKAQSSKLKAQSRRVGPCPTNKAPPHQ